MKSIIYIGGTRPGVGKTLVSLGFLEHLKTKQTVAAYKPIDLGRIDYDAKDVDSDGELLFAAANMSEHQSLVNPYLFHHKFSPELSARIEGISLKAETIDSYLKLLQQRFDTVVIEGMSGLLTPICKGLHELAWLEQHQPETYWVCDVGSQALSDALLQLTMLKQHHINIKGIFLNNALKVSNGELIQHQWLTLEEQLEVPVLGLIPPISGGVNNPNAIGKIIANLLTPDEADHGTSN